MRHFHLNRSPAMAAVLSTCSVASTEEAEPLLGRHASTRKNQVQAQGRKSNLTAFFSGRQIRSPGSTTLSGECNRKSTIRRKRLNFCRHLALASPQGRFPVPISGDISHKPTFGPELTPVCRH